MNKSGWFFIITFLVLISICLILGQLFINDCFWWECAPERSFRISDLEIPRSFFTESTIWNSIHPLSEGEGAVEDGIQTIYPKGENGIVIYEILKFPTRKIADDKYIFYKKHMTDDITKELWEPIKEKSHFSSAANQMFLGCGMWQEYRCGMIAQYQEYIVFITGTINEKMTYERLNSIFLFIDSKFSEKLTDN